MDSFFGSIAFLLKMVLLLAVIAVVIGVVSYNKLQQGGQAVKSSHATVLTVIQKRVDLINKLMDIAKDYGNHEKLVYISVSQNMAETFKSSEHALANVNSMAMAYPELKANGTYQALMQQINVVENELQQKREMYNRFAQTYNSGRLQIPTVFFSKLLGFQEAPYFDFDNLQELRDFKTDDGQMLQAVLSNASSKAMDMTQKGVNKMQEKVQQASVASEHTIKQMVDNHRGVNANGIPCALCGAINEPRSKFCANCGGGLVERELPKEEKVCPKCGALRSGEGSFCGSCGAKF